MTTRTLHPRALDYLDRLRRAGGRLPRQRRGELVAEIEAHLSEAISSDASDAEALNVLDRLGEPEAIVEAEQPRPTVAMDSRGTQEWAAIVLLLLGGFFAGIGWLAGLICLWGSRAWSTRDKWIGTLVVPGGLATPLFISAGVGVSSGESCFRAENGPEHCTGGASTGTQILTIAVLLILVLAPIVTAIYLARRAGESPYHAMS